MRTKEVTLPPQVSQSPPHEGHSSIPEQPLPTKQLLGAIVDYLGSLQVKPLRPYPSYIEKKDGVDEKGRELVQSGALVLREWIRTHPKKQQTIPLPYKTDAEKAMWRDFSVVHEGEKRYKVRAELPPDKENIKYVNVPKGYMNQFEIHMEDNRTGEEMSFSLARNNMFDLYIKYKDSAKRFSPRAGIVDKDGKPLSSTSFDPYEQTGRITNDLRNVDAQFVLYFIGDFIQTVVERLPVEERPLTIPHDIFAQHNVRDNSAYIQEPSGGLPVSKKYEQAS